MGRAIEVAILKLLDWPSIPPGERWCDDEKVETPKPKDPPKRETWRDRKPLL